VDIYGMHMDIVHTNNTWTEPRLRTPKGAADLEAAKDDRQMLELYRYVMPEVVVTNRECGEDETHYLADAGFSFMMGLKFDMTIYRCCGSFSDIPRYTEYLKELNALYHQHEKYLLHGRFVDTDGFTWNNPYVHVKGYLADDGTMAVVAWNPTADDREVAVVRNGHVFHVKVDAERVAVVEVG